MKQLNNKQKPSQSNIDLAEELLTKTLKHLLKMIDEGLATASDLNVARQLLKDSDISILPRGFSNLPELTFTQTKSTKKFEMIDPDTIKLDIKDFVN